MAADGSPDLPSPFDEPITDDALRAAMKVRMGMAEEADPDEDEFIEEDEDFDDLEADAGDEDDSSQEEPPRLTGDAEDGGAGSGAEPRHQTEDGIPDGYFRVGDQLYSRDQEEDLARLIQWSMDQINQAPVQPPQQQYQPAPAAALPLEPAFNPDDFIDPELARVVDTRFTESLSPLQSSVDQLLAIEQARQHREASERQAAIALAADQAAHDVATAFNLSPEESQRLQNITVQSGLVAVAQQTTGGTEVEVFTHALESAYWMTPEFRDRAIQQSAELTAAELVAQAKDAAQSSATAGRRSRAGALAGGSAPVARTAPAPKTKTDRRSAMVKRLAELQGDS